MSIEAIRELETLASVCPELNMANYTEDDVRHLNDWAIEMSLLVERYALSQQPATTEPVEDGIRNAEDELNCAEEVLDAITCEFSDGEFPVTDFNCIGDYITAVVDVFKERLAAQQPATGEPVANDGWRQDRGLLYRLTDEQNPQNRDEIKVMMADSSRSDASCTRRAGELLDRIRATHPAPSVPEFSRIAKLKLDELQKQGFTITGYAIQRGTQRGFITNGGFVGWRRSDEAPRVPEGCALVPIEPTQAMLNVQTWDFSRFYSPREIWAAMLAAK